MKEIWKSIFGFEGQYEVSTFGRVRSLDRWVPHSKPAAGGYMRKGVMMYIKHDCSKKNKHKWSRVGLCNEGKSKLYNLSKIVYETFSRDLLPTELIHHLDGDPTNCHIDNLAPLTRSESMTRMREIHGYIGCRKLSVYEVEDYRRRYNSGEKCKDLIKESRLAESSFRYMLKKSTYKR